MQDIFQILRSHRSIRKFKPDPIPEKLLGDILDSARQAPTSSNLQAYSIVIVRDRVKRKEFAKLSGDQQWVEACPIFLVVCADLYRLEKVCRIRGYKMSDRHIESFIVPVIDAALVAQNILVAAEANGLGICMVGGIRRDPANVCRMLKLPERVFPLVGMCLGYPDQEGAVKPRLPHEVIIHEDEYSDQNLEKHVAEYDNLLRAGGLYDGPRRKIPSPDGRTIPDSEYGWSEHSARRLASTDSKTLRVHLKGFLESQKFGFE